MKNLLYLGFTATAIIFGRFARKRCLNRYIFLTPPLANWSSCGYGLANKELGLG
jgi:hypothetical protein